LRNLGDSGGKLKKSQQIVDSTEEEKKEK